MKKIKCGAILIVILMLAVMSTACKGEIADEVNVSPADEAKEEDVQMDSLTMPIPNDIGDLNAHLYNGSIYAQGLIFEGLVENTNDGPKPRLAERWEISEDGKVYTFYLRQDVVFTDGEAFNAAAVKANIDAILENKTTHGWLMLTNKIVSCDVVDEHVVKLVLSDAYYPTLIELGLTRPYRMMSPATFIDGHTKDGVANIIGTGPYKLSDHVVDQKATFIANEKYWGGVPGIKNFHMKVMPSGETTLFAMLNNEIDFIFSSETAGIIDVEALKTLENNEDFQVVKGHPSLTRNLLTNSLSDRMISDVNIKQAVWHAIDRESIANHIFSGFERPADTVFARESPYCDVELEKKPYNVEKAKSLIEASGWVFDDSTGYYTKDETTLTLELVYRSTLTLTKSLSEFIQGNLKAVGIKTQLTPVEGSALRKIRNAGNYDLVLDRSWGLPYDPQSSLTGLFSEMAYLNAAIELDSYDVLKATVENALISTDEEKRKQLFEKALGIVHEECVFIPLTYSSPTITARKELKGITFSQTHLEFPLNKFYY